MRNTLRWATLMMIVCLPNVLWAGISISIASAPGGVPISSGTMTIGNMNALGIGTAPTGTSLITSGVSGGALYSSPYVLQVALTGADKNTNVTITAAVTSAFAHPTMLAAESCQPGTCTSGGNFTVIPATGNITVVPSTLISGSGGTLTQTFTPYIAIFVAAANGASFSSDQATVTFTATDITIGNSSTATLTLVPSVQTAMQLTLGTAPGGLSITPATDYAVNFGNVNGLGIGTPSAGITKTAVAGGEVYATAYLIQPVFSDFASTTGHVSVYVSTDFAHPSTLTLQDATAATGPFTAIAKTAGSPTSISSTAASGSSITRYLGLKVSNANGAGIFPGTAGASGGDNSILTFTLTVP